MLKKCWRFIIPAISLHSGVAFVPQSHRRPKIVALQRRHLTSRLAVKENPLPIVSSFSSIIDKYDAFLLDQFGVVHDGKTCYEGSAECIRELQRLKKRVVILSNSSKRRRDTVDRLHALNCGMCTWLDAGTIADIPLINVVTSGDLVHQGLRDAQNPAPRRGALGSHPFFANLGGPYCHVFGNGDDDVSYCATAGLIPSSIENADFILARGLFCTISGKDSVEPLNYGDDIASIDSTLVQSYARGLPMIVANPDLVRPDGLDSPMPGQLGQRYEALGGKVFQVGKPFDLIYDEALQILAEGGIDVNRICAVGDSMHHDVAGAVSKGIASVFVTGGVHAGELGVPQGAHQVPDVSVLGDFFSNFQEEPTWTVAGFVLTETAA
mmetsp:Transcript_24606/g.33718  ORF Transcript_24606/g.33718 Transcript_24606/m.33718 type:complete len:381 (-) Transcript_24606:332-1474(-)